MELIRNPKELTDKQIQQDIALNGPTPTKFFIEHGGCLNFYVKEHTKYGYQRSNDTRAVIARKLRKKKAQHAKKYN